ncbi:hypothetical protein [Streptomyces sp. NPDC060333]|uniref:hypothetical protein n=1 Tax=Streptomyces sp. NPDC060333 TaxID=3347098 RepID=UPI0036536976
MTDRLPRFQRCRGALERFAPLAWMKSNSETNGITHLVEPPTIGWRFSEPDAGGEGPHDLSITSDQDFCVAASEDIVLIIDALAAQPAPPTAARLFVFQIARASADVLVCVAESFTGEAQVGMVFRPVGLPDVEGRLTALSWYPPRPETQRRGPLAKVTLMGKGVGRIGRKELLVSLPGADAHE